jgi:HrpA-like RNA helicase
MSATLQDGLFSSYFNDCPLVSVQGRAYPVMSHYLEEVQALVGRAQRQVAVERGKATHSSYKHDKDYSGQSNRKGKKPYARKAALLSPVRRVHSEEGDDESDDTAGTAVEKKKPKFDADCTAELVIRIIQTFKNTAAIAARENVVDASAVRGESILVFLSGLQAIESVSRALRQRNLASLNAFVLPLHGLLSAQQQRRVFVPARPGEWKIILSTNIAETSVTVDDVTHVVDTGFYKEVDYLLATAAYSIFISNI